MTESKPIEKTALQKKIETLETKLRQAKALAARKENAERKKAESIARQIDTRRKVLIGAFMLAGDVNPIHLVNSQNQTLDQWLTRPDERQLFGLGEAQN